VFGGTQGRWGLPVGYTWAAALVLGLCALSNVSVAQVATLSDGGMDLHLFRPAVDSRGYFSVNGTEVMPHKDFSFGLVLDAGFGILRYNGFVNDPDGAADTAGRQSRIAKQAFTGTFMFNIGLVDRLVLGIQLPITFFRGDAVQTPPLGGACTLGAGCLYNNQAGGLRSQGVGDLTLLVKARLLNLGEYPAGIAVTLRAGFPTAKTTQFAGEPGYSLWPTAVFEFQPIEKIRLAFEGGYRWISGQGATFIWDGRSDPAGLGIPTANAVDPVDQGTGRQFTYDDLITFGFGSAFRIASSLDFIVEFYGSQIAREIGTKGTLSMEVLGGFKYFVTNKSFLFVAAGAGIPKTGFEAADVRAWGFGQQVKMVIHQAIGVYPDVIGILAFIQTPQNAIAITVIRKDSPPPRSPNNDVIDRPLKLKSQFPCHAPRLL